MGQDQSKREDCYFYYYTSEGCQKEDCRYRHEPASKGNEIRCKDFIENEECERKHCKFRHMKENKDRSQILCYHETKGGCRKDDCPFYHRAGRAKEDAVMFCAECDKVFPNEHDYADHLASSQHKKRLIQLLGPELPTSKPASKPTIPASKPELPVSMPDSEPTTIPASKPEIPESRDVVKEVYSFCELCQVKSTNEGAHMAHIEGKKHKSNLAKAEALLSSKDVESDDSDAESVTSQNLTKKDPAKRGQRKKKQNKPGEAQKKGANKDQNANKDQKGIVFDCKICNFKASNKYFYDEHMNSNQHRAMIENKGGAKGKFQNKGGHHPRYQGPGQSPRMPLPPKSLMGIPPPAPRFPSPPPPYSAVPRNIPSNNSAPNLTNNNNSDKRSLARFDDVAIFWDIENCPLKKNVSAVAFISKIRNQFLAPRQRELKFMVVLDTSDNSKIAASLQEMNVTVIPKLKGNRKNEADDILRQEMRKFVDTQHRKCSLLLISGDVDFSNDLHNFRHIRNHEVLLMHNFQAKDSLKAMANRCFSFHGFVKDLPVEQGECRSRSSSKPRKPAKERVQQAKNVNPKSGNDKEGVVILWDLKACSPPKGFSAVSIVAMIRDHFFQEASKKIVEIAFMATSPGKYRNDLVELGLKVSELQSPSEMLSEFVEKDSTRFQRIILLSSDPGLISIIRKLRYEMSKDVLLFYTGSVKDTLKVTVGQDRCKDIGMILGQQTNDQRTMDPDEKKELMLKVLDKLMDM